MTETDVVRTLASRFSWPGADFEDVLQEAWFALERCRARYEASRGKSWLSFAWMCVSSHLIEIQRRECYRRPRFVELSDRHSGSRDVVDVVEARSRLRTVLELPLGDREREAVNRQLVGLPCPRDGRWLDTAWQRAKPKLLAAV